MSVVCHKCEDKCGKGKASNEIVAELEDQYLELLKGNSKSLLKKYLTRAIFNAIKTKKTSYKMTLLDCIRTVLENPDSSVGIYAACPECYDVFADIFDPIIQDYHNDFKKSHEQPPVDFGDFNLLGDIDPKKQFIVSTRIRCARAIPGYAFAPGLTENQYLEIEEKIVTALSELTGDLEGSYVPLNYMTPDEITKLVEEHYLFKEGDRYLQAANACRFWPTGRGIFYNPSKTFIVWVNEEDHMRIISLQEGGNLKEVYERFVNAATELDSKLHFLKHERLGYLSFCPTNLGTSIRASVHMKIPNLAENQSELKVIADQLQLQIRGTAGEHSQTVGGIYDVSNKRRLGITEIEVIKEMAAGIKELIKLEKEAK